MRSIRLSLIVYFALLLTAALAAVSWLVYQTTAHALEERRQAAQELIREHCQERINEARQGLDNVLLRRAQTLSGLAHPIFVHNEVVYLITSSGAVLAPEAPFSLAATLYTSQARFPPIGPRELTTIVGAEDLIPELETGPEYFQTYRKSGQALQRSDSLGEHWLTLDPHIRDTAELLQEQFDDVDLEARVHLRRVTLLVPKQSQFFFRRRMTPRGPGISAPTPPPSTIRPPPPPGTFPPPTLFIQYASDTADLESEIAAIRRAANDQLAQVDKETLQNLAELSTTLVWIGGVTLTALFLGCFLLIQFGLAPLARLADAVSRVSAKDFRLGVDSRELPRELQPIAERLAQTLQQLGQAFEREKQAAADISHELRTPLASLMTTVEVALRKTRTQQEYQEILEECRLSGSHMSVLVERLLALARLDAGAVPYRPIQVDVADLALQCADLVRPLARARGLALRVAAAEPLPLETDPDKVREVLTNLLHNAIEYNRDGGAIDVAVRRVNGHIELEVADTGIGIPPEAQPHIFERFFRADPSRHADVPHAGLGLAIVKSYIDLMAGRISVESTDRGSTFKVELPV